jgi:hypothetical protein
MSLSLIRSLNIHIIHPMTFADRPDGKQRVTGGGRRGGRDQMREMIDVWMLMGAEKGVGAHLGGLSDPSAPFIPPRPSTCPHGSTSEPAPSIRIRPGKDESKLTIYVGNHVAGLWVLGG